MVDFHETGIPCSSKLGASRHNYGRRISICDKALHMVPKSKKLANLALRNYLITPYQVRQINDTKI